MPDAELELVALPRNVTVARAFVRDTLTGWQCDDAIFSAELIVSELVSNAILHARSDVRLRLDLSTEWLTIEVSDDSSNLPAQRNYPPDATTGRGLGLVGALSAGGWGCRPSPEGKVVWARVSLSGSSAVVPLFDDTAVDDTAVDDTAGHAAAAGSPVTGRPGGSLAFAA